ATGVDIEGLSQQLHRHGRALDVPAGSAASDLRVPGGLVVPGGLPDGEIPGIVLLVLVRVDARLSRGRRGVHAGQPPVAGEGGNPKVERAAALVDVPSLLKPADQ